MVTLSVGVKKEDATASAERDCKQLEMTAGIVMYKLHKQCERRRRILTAAGTLKFTSNDFH